MISNSSTASGAPGFFIGPNFFHSPVQECIDVFVPVERAEALGNIHGFIDDNLERDVGLFLQLVKTQQENAAFHGIELRQWPVSTIEIVRDKKTLERFDEKQGVGTICRDLLVENGLVLRAVGDTIVAAPPFVLSHEEADELVEIVWKCLDLTQQAVK